MNTIREEFDTTSFVEAGLGFLFTEIDRVNWNRTQKDRPCYSHGFENEVFSVFPFYWGDCTCGAEEKIDRWCGENAHKSGCYQEEYWGLTKIYGHLDTPEIEIIRLMEKHNIKFSQDNPIFGCATHCTCDYRKKWDDFIENNDHSASCLLLKPNFKVDNFEVSWYKYPFRSSKMNMKISANDFAVLLEKCLTSVRKLDTIESEG